MSTEENKAVARRYWEELHWGKGVGFGLEEDLFALNYRHYLPGSPGPLDGKGHEHVSIRFYKDIPDAHFTVEDEIAEGDRVVNRYTLRGQSIKYGEVTITGNEIFRIADGRIAEQWSQFETLGGPQYGFVQAAAAVALPGQAS